MTKASRWKDSSLGVVGVLGLLAVWEALTRSGAVNPVIFPPPTAAVAGALAKVPPRDLWEHVSTSLLRILWGFGVGAGLGILVGIASGWYRTLGTLTQPLIDLIRPIPPLAWIPMAIIWFGLGEPSKVFVIFLGAFFPVVTNAYKGMTGVDPILLRAAQTMGLSGPRLLLQVAIPAAMPDIATGLRVGWGLSFGVLVAAELIAADAGMGFMIMHARQSGEIGVIIFGIILIGVTNLLTDYGIGEVIRRKVGRWHAT
jgi:ABC-type nitrate/sulfonate/bicarbonate transport system permease component